MLSDYHSLTGPIRPFFIVLSRARMEDISKALVYEIKQDIANRYFGFRKQIETDSSQYLLGLQGVDEKYAINIATSMQRMHCLLQNDRLFSSFIQLTGIPESFGNLHADPHSPVEWQRLFVGLGGKGFTRRRRFRNLVYQVYRLLTDDINAYREIYTNLDEEHEDICKEIDRFYRMNDLSGILNFLREIDNADSMHSALLSADNPTLAGQNMEKELRIFPPPAVTTRMPLLPELPLFDAAREKLDSLASEAFTLFDYSGIEKLPF